MSELRRETARQQGYRNRKHGHRRPGIASRTYSTWIAMRSRCRSETNPNWPNYGGRGIRVCDRWHSFENFLADMGERPCGTSIDRRDPDGHYEPGNCRWATASQQTRNRPTLRRDVTFNGVTKQVVEWAEELGWSRHAMLYRVKNMPLDRALTKKGARA